MTSPGNESAKDWQRKNNEATRLTVAARGPEPRHNELHQAIITVFAVGIPVTAAFMIAGVQTARAEWAIVIVSLSASAVVYVRQKCATKAWYKTYEQWMRNLS